jgi:hypothetical protein
MSSCWDWWVTQVGKSYHSLPKINSANSWCAQRNDQDQWLQIDLEEKKDVVGVATQGRTWGNQWVTTYKVSVSDDGKDFTEVECGRIFDGNTDSNTKVRNYFTTPVKARYIRVHPMTWVGHISLRMGVLICETKCSNDHLDYEMLTQASSTGGPLLGLPWGQGISLPKPPKTIRGVDFYGYDLGYQDISVDDCMKKCKERRDCVGFVQKASQNGDKPKGCWLKYELENFNENGGLDTVFRTDTRYYRYRSPYGLRVTTHNQGVQVSPGSCIKTEKEYTLLMEMRLDRVTGYAVRLVSSKDCGHRGAFVYNQMFAIYPWFRGLKCQEDIKAGFFYKFGITRTKDKKVSLYLNGWLCASAYPPYANAFSLDEEAFNILHDENNEYNSQGWVRRIQLWKEAKSPSDMLDINDCKLSVMKDYADYAYGFNQNTIGVKSDKVSFSSVRDKNDNEWGQGNGLNTRGCWSPASADMDEWLQIDLGKNRTIGTISTQGDPARAWQVTGFVVKVSYDEVEWLDVQCGRIWNTQWTGDTNRIYSLKFEKPVVAQYIRFIPITWVNWPAMRVAVIGVGNSLWYFACFDGIQQLFIDIFYKFHAFYIVDVITNFNLERISNHITVNINDDTC